MRPLINYCRWQGVTLRLRGRDADSVWGELVGDPGADDEQLQEFRYELQTRIITLVGQSGERRQQLDEMGVIVG
jgi:hypothetical protein